MGNIAQIIKSHISFASPISIDFAFVSRFKIRFRISYTSKNLYTLLGSVYGGSRPNPVNDSVVFNSAVLGNAENITTSDEFLQNAAHMINRMILQWELFRFKQVRWLCIIRHLTFRCTTPLGTSCSASDFTPLSTDYGICYAINSDIYNPWNVTSAGRFRRLYDSDWFFKFFSGNSYGFQLLLNAETYEITNNPSKTAGFKVRLLFEVVWGRARRGV
jgi:hypothetical protein